MDIEMASSSPETPCPSRGGRRSIQSDAGLTAQERPIDSPAGSTDRAALVDISSPIERSGAGLDSDGSGSEDDSAKTISSSSSSSSRRRPHDDNSDSENSSPDPDRFEISPRDLPLKINMDRLPNALAGTPLGQGIKAAAAETRRELLGELNGVDYGNHRPLAGMHPDFQTRQLWALHIQPDANAIITQIISTNIDTINHILAQLTARYALLKQQSFQLVHLSTLPTTSRAWLRDEVARNIAETEEHEAWEEILALELQMSNVALERVRIASGVAKYERQMNAGEITEREMFWLINAQLPAYQVRRVVLLRLARQVYEMSGSGEFLERHGNELWDVVLV